MITRRSRKEGVASPSDAEIPSKAKRSATPSSKAKRSATPSKAKKTITPRRRSKSKSVDRKIRTRSRSVNKTVSPRVVLERYEPKKESPIDKKKEIKSKIVKLYITLSI